VSVKRKKDLRKKYLLGEIVVRAGLSTADRAFLLGGLLELARLLPDTAEFQRLRNRGEMAFRAKASDPHWQEKPDAVQ